MEWVKVEEPKKMMLFSMRHKSDQKIYEYINSTGFTAISICFDSTTNEFVLFYYS